MPTIRLTDAEVEHLRGFYADELKEAIKYVEQVKTLIARLKIKKKPKVTKPAAKQDGIQQAKKQGRKSAVTVETVKTQEPLPLIRKANAPKKISVTPAVEPAKKRGRKPAERVDVIKTQKPSSKVRAKRGAGKKKAEPKKVLPEIPSVVPAERIAANAVQEKPNVNVEPKPKRKRIHNADHKGKVLLAGWGKPLGKKPAKPKGDGSVSF